jgi:hypothetical protein
MSTAAWMRKRRIGLKYFFAANRETGWLQVICVGNGDDGECADLTIRPSRTTAHHSLG